MLNGQALSYRPVIRALFIMFINHHHSPTKLTYTPSLKPLKLILRDQNTSISKFTSTSNRAHKG
jgi:hypothetical protein